ncbi:SAF domain-containing protein [Idiomarina sp. PL1-037]|uniref:Flp pilus assembly protein CpaB n=1 Tax=Idiomarina TaxID=135575 RepID=UPI00294AED8A|nr:MULTISPECIES: SAF domain-containing protein [unclassified Idiomarina]MDV6326597.1 SAF domain-containing protein [Idiomarina sp. Sol25]WQC53982.1 SAF domain-containing protein [Idiomarina sp. PL1-037]
MTKKAKWIFAVIFSSIISMVTVFLIHQYLQKETSRRLQEASGSAGSVVVFSKDLNAGDILEVSDLLVRKYPHELINEHWYLESSASLVIGRKLRNSVKSGEPVSERILSNNQNSGLSEVLPNGYYAITVTTDNLGHHNALLKVGDQVDIVFAGDSFESSREYLSFEKIEVFDIHGLQEGYGSYSLTLLVEPEKVAAFTKAIGSPMLVWARSRHLDQVSIWHQDSKQSKVQPWKVQ